jgi:glucose/arabinose dehydrogenase
MQPKTFFYLSTILFGLCSSGCINNNPSSTNSFVVDSTQLPPVETQKANSNYKPAFKGQTRIAGVKTVTPFKVEKIAEKQGLLWAIVPMPDGRLLITEKTGYMQILDTSGEPVKKITGFPKVEDAGQGGMLDVALDPDFASNKTIYWSFSEKYQAGNLTSVAKGQLNEAGSIIENPVVIFRAKPAFKQQSAFRLTTDI